MPSISSLPPVGLVERYRLLSSPPTDHRYSWRLSDDVTLCDFLKASLPSKTFSTLDAKSIWVVFDMRAHTTDDAQMLEAIVQVQRKNAQRHADYKHADTSLYGTKADKTANRKQKQRVDDDFKKSARAIGEGAGLITGRCTSRS